MTVSLSCSLSLFLSGGLRRSAVRWCTAGSAWP
jgi:hypothetical protein